MNDYDLTDDELRTYENCDQCGALECASFYTLDPVGDRINLCFECSEEEPC